VGGAPLDHSWVENNFLVGGNERLRVVSVGSEVETFGGKHWPTANPGKGNCSPLRQGIDGCNQRVRGKHTVRPLKRFDCQQGMSQKKRGGKQTEEKKTQKTCLNSAKVFKWGMKKVSRDLYGRGEISKKKGWGCCPGQKTAVEGGMYSCNGEDAVNRFEFPMNEREGVPLGRGGGKKYLHPTIRRIKKELTKGLQID